MNAKKIRGFFSALSAIVMILAIFCVSPKSSGAASSGNLLSGTVKSASGMKLGGVSVSAQAEGKPITTSVFTDEDGGYYFPAMDAGTYTVWAQADSFETARTSVSLNGSKHEDFVLKPMKDFARQLTGDQLLASLPEDTPDDKRLKRVFRNSCTSCHQPNYILQNRFDEAGWTAIFQAMEHFNVAGGYMGPDSAPIPSIRFYEKELAAYLARARGPEPSSMKFHVRPRPAGDAARVVFTEYDVPMPAATGEKPKYVLNNGSDWSDGTPSVMFGNHGVHDAAADFDGNIWFSINAVNPYGSFGRVDAKTGEVKYFPVQGPNGKLVTGHGIARDSQGHIWFDLGPAKANGPGRLADVNPAAQTFQLYTAPETMEGPTTIAGTMDVDGKGKIWASTFHGASRFDPVTKEFTEYKSPTFRTATELGNTYGLTADGEGNGWWAEMNLDLVGKTDLETGKITEVKIPPVPGVKELFSPAELKLYEESGSTWNTAVPWAEGPRRLGADKTGHSVWVCNWWGGSLAKIDTRTLQVTMIPLPHPMEQQPYQAQVDKDHNVWINLMNSDEVIKYDPAANQWTEYPFPTLGGEPRYISLLEHGGSLQVIIPYSRARRVARMTFRSKEDLQALKIEAQQSAQLR